MTSWIHRHHCAPEMIGTIPTKSMNPKTNSILGKIKNDDGSRSGSFTEDRNDLPKKKSFGDRDPTRKCFKSSLRVSNTKSYGSCRGFLITKCLDPWRFFINFIGFIACFTSLGPPCESPILDFLKESMFFEGHNGPWRSGVGLNQKN